MLRLENVSKTFYPGTVNEKKVFDHLDLHVKQGDFVTVIGANGAGKSTLFNVISGAFPLDGGSVILNGKNITFMP